MPVQNPASLVTWTFLDYKSKKATLTLHAEENAGAVTMGGILSGLQTLETAFADLSGGTVSKMSFAPYVTEYGEIPTNNTNVQIERQWKVVYRDNVNFKQGIFSVPCARVSDPANNSIVDLEGFAILSSDQWTGFKTIFEQVARSVDNNTVTLLYAYIDDVNL